MARKNQDKAKEIFKRLSSEILKYGEEGKADLRDVFELHKPEVIFKLNFGPERQARAAQLIGEMREISRDLAQAKYHRDREDAKLRPKKAERRTLSGVHDGFKYILTDRPDGRWEAKITRQARQVIPHPDAPVIVGSPALRKPFDSQHDAELAVRRAINTAMIWYSERGISPMERARRTKSIRGGVQRRTAGQVAARESERDRKAKSSDDARLRAERAEDRRKEKEKKRMSRRPDEAAPSRRKIQYIPRKNPWKPFSFKHSETSASKQGEKSFIKYKEWEAMWSKSLKDDAPDFRSVMKAYDHVENARANFTLSGDMKRAGDAANFKKILRTNIIGILNACTMELKKRKSNPSSNPSPEDHDKIAIGHMRTADTAWNNHCESGSSAAALKAYKHLELAREGFVHSGNAEGVADSKNKIKQARAALLSSKR